MFLRELFWAVRTGKFLSRVNHLVSPHITFLWKQLATGQTRISPEFQSSWSFLNNIITCSFWNCLGSSSTLAKMKRFVLTRYTGICIHHIIDILAILITMVTVQCVQTHHEGLLLSCVHYSHWNWVHKCCNRIQESMSALVHMQFIRPFFFFISWFTDSFDLNFGHFQKKKKKLYKICLFFPLRCAFLSK